MTNNPVAELQEPEYRRVWDRFYAEFNFHPSVNADAWPAITEPVGSSTWSLKSLPDEPDYQRLDGLVEVVEKGLTSCTNSHSRLLALDWQHVSYSFSPHHVGGEGQQPWPLSPYPDGDYYIFLSEDFRLGSFGHPWEKSICLFGPELLDAVSAEIDAILGPPIRTSGRPTHLAGTTTPPRAPRPS